MMPAHQIWSCHVTQDANLKIFYFVLILHLMFGKVTKISSGKALYFRSYQQKTSPGGGVENTPSAFRVNPRSKSSFADYYKIENSWLFGNDSKVKDVVYRHCQWSGK